MFKKEDIEEFHIPRWEELPEIDLYLVPYITDLGFGVEAAAFPLYLGGKSTYIRSYTVKI